MEIPIFGIGQQGKSPVVTSQKKVNVYFEIQRDPDRSLITAYGTPGLKSPLVTFGDLPIRGMITVNNLIYIVHRGTLYSVNNAGTKTTLGVLNTTQGFVDMTYNGTEILMVDGTNGYIYNVTYNTFFQVSLVSSGTTTTTTANKLVDSGGAFDTDGTKAGMVVFNTTDGTRATITAIDSATTLSIDTDIMASGEDYEIGEDDFPDGATTCDFLDGYFLVELGGFFYISGSYLGMAWDATEFANAETSPDGIVRLFVDHSEIILFGDNTTEYWGNSGNTDFPFTRVQGTSDEWGLAAKLSVTKFNNSYMYLAQNTLGEVMLVISSGYIPAPIEDYEFHSKINEYDTVSDARSYSYMLGGHPMYVIHFPTQGTSWLYDGSTGIISELKSKGLERHRSDLHVNFLKKNYVSDFQTGTLYQLDKDTYEDNGETILRLLRSKHDHNKNHTEVIVDRVEVLMESGVGLANGQGEDPKLMFRTSKDKGRTWSGEMTSTIGKQGEYDEPRCLFDDLGSSRNFTYEISMSDPVKFVLTGVNRSRRDAQV